MLNQIKALVCKNLLISLRNQEIFMDCIVPLVVAMMLSLKAQLSTLNQILPIVYALAIFTTSRSIMIRLVEEKSKRFRETQRIMGMQKWSYMIGWLITAYIRIFIALTMFILSQLMFNAIFHLNWNFYYRDSLGNQFWPYFLYGITAVNQSFLFASIFNDTRIAGEVSTFFCVGMSFFVFFTFMESAASSLAFYVIIGLFSPQCTVAFGYVASLAVGYNRLGAKHTWYNPRKQVPMNIFPVELINQYYDLDQSGYQLIGTFFLYLILFLYFDQVIPNEYGIAQKPLFFLDWFKKSQDKQETHNILMDEENTDTSSAIYHEQLHFDKTPTITIKNLNKHFDKYVAVNNITLNLYESQIFCLLGHNGAGKTTTISLLTGMISKTSGIVNIYGYDLDRDLDKIRLNLGLCTQKDCLYDDLTVLEHLKFICSIKGVNVHNLELEEILDITELIDEQNLLVSKLSGGSKRKLSLAMSLVGNSQVIFLDEPTSGMDALSRRAIWNILKKIKQQKRTIILTTHYLDEADLLADRIGIMSKGQFLAMGTADYIKRQFGEGYTLTIRGEQLDHKIVPNYIEESQLINEMSNECMLTYQIPFKSQGNLIHLFKELEQKKFKIEMKLNTLEDAFVKIGEEEEKFLAQKGQSDTIKEQTLQDIKKQSEQIDDDYTHKFNVPECVKQPPVYYFTNQCAAMFIRRFYTTIRTDTNILAFFMPIMTFVLGLLVTNYVQFSGKLAHNETSQLFLKIAVLGAVGVIGFSFNSTLYVTLPVLEKECFLKQVLRGTGCRIEAYWIGTFLFDIIVYGLLTSSYFITAIALQLTAVTDYWWQTLLLFMTFGFSYITFTYIGSFLFQQVEKAMRLFVIWTFFCCFCIPFVLLGVISFGINYGQSSPLVGLIYFFEIIFMVLSPFYNFYLAYVTMPNLTSHVKAELGGMPLITYSFTVYCCMMLLQGILFSTIIYILDQVLYQKYEQTSCDYQQLTLENDVQEEQDRLLNGDCDDLIQAKQLIKYYVKNGQQVLKNVTFGVKQGEIMGIIGPNGAGKSTLMNIFTNMIIPTQGEVLLNKINQNREKQLNIMQRIGICPQFDCIWENLTTIEHLQLFGRLKGLGGKQLDEAVKYFIQTMELTCFKNTKAGALSGGNKRKLCVSDALIGGSDITFFDEPSTGVDPISRRSLFNTLKRNVSLRNCSVIITTHTIEEAENLSDKLGILITGQFVCIGKPEYLRTKYSDGYHISIKHTHRTTKEQLIKILEQQFVDLSQIEDTRQQFLAIQVQAKSFSFYKTFQLLEDMKSENLVDDFSITECSLESIFVHFSKIQAEQNNQDGVAMV